MKPFSILLSGLILISFQLAAVAASTESVKKAYSPYDQERKETVAPKAAKPQAVTKEKAKPSAKKESVQDSKPKSSKSAKSAVKKEKSREKAEKTRATSKKDSARQEAKGKTAKGKAKIVLPPPSVKVSTSVPSMPASVTAKEVSSPKSVSSVKPLPALPDDPRAKDLEQPFGWRVDRYFRYQITFVDEQPKAKCRNCERGRPFSLSEEGRPESDSRSLNALLDEGYPVPEKDSAQDYKLYLKSYQWPRGSAPGEIIVPMMESFGLDRLRGGDSVIFFGSSRDSLILRHGVVASSGAVFAPGDAFPPFFLDKSREARQAFYRALPISRLFVRPIQWEEKFKDDAERFEYSLKGLREFHRQLVAGYKASLTEMHCSESDRTLCFEDTRCYATKERPCRAILKLPREITVFEDWKTRPLPTDPAHHFLGGMFTVYRLQTDPATGSPLAPAAMLEAAAAVRVP